MGISYKKELAQPEEQLREIGLIEWDNKLGKYVVNPRVVSSVLAKVSESKVPEIYRKLADEELAMAKEFAEKLSGRGAGGGFSSGPRFARWLLYLREGNPDKSPRELFEMIIEEGREIIGLLQTKEEYPGVFLESIKGYISVLLKRGEIDPNLAIMVSTWAELMHSFHLPY